MSDAERIKKQLEEETQRALEEAKVERQKKTLRLKDALNPQGLSSNFLGLLDLAIEAFNYRELGAFYGCLWAVDNENDGTAWNRTADTIRREASELAAAIPLLESNEWRQLADSLVEQIPGVPRTVFEIEAIDQAKDEDREEWSKLNETSTEETERYVFVNRSKGKLRVKVRVESLGELTAKVAATHSG